MSGGGAILSLWFQMCLMQLIQCISLQANIFIIDGGGKSFQGVARYLIYSVNVETFTWVNCAFKVSRE